MSDKDIESQGDLTVGVNVDGTVYAYPTRSRCPTRDGGCGSIETEQYCTQHPIQYRKCRVCGHTYKVMGWRI